MDCNQLRICCEIRLLHCSPMSSGSTKTFLNAITFVEVDWEKECYIKYVFLVLALT